MLCTRHRSTHSVSSTHLHQMGSTEPSPKPQQRRQHGPRRRSHQRRRVLKTLLTFILDNQEDIVRAACLDSGKTRVDALFGEVLVTVEKLKWTVDHGEKALKAERRPANLLMFYKKNEVRYEPLGVVAACVSWKYASLLSFNPLNVRSKSLSLASASAS